jgi:hypothetical protein
VHPSVQVVFDCAQPDTLADFWADVLGYVKQPPPEGFDSWNDFAASIGMPKEQWDGWSAVIDPEGKRPRVFFQRVPEGKVVKNRVHLDVNVGEGLEGDERIARIKREADRVEGLGATRVREAEERGEFWIVMQDIEGNEFCLQ